MNPGYNLADLNNDETAGPHITFSDVVLTMINVGRNPKKYNLHFTPGPFWANVKKKEPFKTTFDGLSLSDLNYYWRLICKEGRFDDYYRLVDKKKWLLDYCGVPAIRIFHGISCYFNGTVPSLEEYFLTRIKFDYMKDRARKLIDDHKNKSKI